LSDKKNVNSNDHNLNGFLYNEEAGIYVYPNNTSLNYLDGAEKYISDTIKNATDLSSCSRELIDHIKDWPSRYHFSIKRNNLLEGLADLFDKDSNVLELGSGCGTITRWLGENFREVDAIEGSFSRACITKLRSRGLEHVNVYCDDIMRVSFDKKYDIATMIGVLEYVPFYDKDRDDPTRSCVSILKKLNDALSEQGILVLAIENKMGIKYFTGCSEDHTMRQYDGLAGYPDKTPVTFSRYELEEMLKKAGFTNIQFYHLFPDYKLADTIVTENENVQSLRPYNWIKLPFNDYSGPRWYSIPEILALKTITDSSLFWQFSNSFIVLASKSEKVNLKVDWKIKKFYNDDFHNKAFYHQITLEKADEIGYVVKRRPIAGNLKNIELENIAFSLEDQKYIAGELLSMEIARAVLKTDSDQSVKSTIKTLFDGLITDYSTGRSDESGYDLVKGDAIDYTFWNLIISDNKIHYIDRKWKIKKDIPADFVVFRSLFYMYDTLSPFLTEKDVASFIIGNMRSLYPQYDIKRLDDNVRSEEEFQSAVCSRKVKLSLSRPQVYSIAQQIRRAYDSEYDLERIKRLESGIADRDARLATLGAIVSARDQEINEMRASILWRLAMAYQKTIVDRFFRIGTHRRDVYDSLLRRARNIANGKK
jgi:O-antigen biosynthesis protein